MWSALDGARPAARRLPAVVVPAAVLPFCRRPPLRRRSRLRRSHARHGASLPTPSLGLSLSGGLGCVHEHEPFNHLAHRLPHRLALGHARVVGPKRRYLLRHTDQRVADGARGHVHVHRAELPALHARPQDADEDLAPPVAELLAEQASAVGELGALDLDYPHQVQDAGLPRAVPQTAQELREQLAHEAAMAGEARLLRLDERHESLGDDLLEQPGFAAEIVGHGARTHAGVLRDIGQSGALVAISTEGDHGTIEDLRPAGIGASLPPRRPHIVYSICHQSVTTRHPGKSGPGLAAANPDYYLSGQIISPFG